MARTVYFHIGAPKTGTTYLQAVMAQNREVLQEQGVLYADGRYPGDRVHATELARGHDHSANPRAEGAWRRIVRQVQGWDGDAVISHEFFGACTESQARALVEDLTPAQVHVVFTTRDYVRQATAAWQERLKYGRAVRLSEFTLDERNGTPMWSWRTLDAVAVLARWSAGLDPADVHVVTVPPSGTPGDVLWERFAATIGIDPASCRTAVPFANSSLGVVEAELLRRFGDRLPEKFNDRRKAAAYVRNILANEILASRKGERLTLSQSHAAELNQASREAVAAITAAGYRVVGDLAELVPGEVRSGRAPEDVTEPELLDAALDAVAGLLSAMEARDEQRRQRAQGRAPHDGPGNVASSDTRLVRLARRIVRRSRRLRG